MQNKSALLKIVSLLLLFSIIAIYLLTNNTNAKTIRQKESTIQEKETETEKEIKKEFGNQKNELEEMKDEFNSMKEELRKMNQFSQVFENQKEILSEIKKVSEIVSSTNTLPTQKENTLNNEKEIKKIEKQENLEKDEMEEKIKQLDNEFKENSALKAEEDDSFQFFLEDKPSNKNWLDSITPDELLTLYSTYHKWAIKSKNIKSVKILLYTPG